jgi:chromosome segregation ATPase
MALPKDDIQTIEDALERKINPLSHQIQHVSKELHEDIANVRATVRESEGRLTKRIQEQTLHLSKAITESAKMIAESHPTKEEFREALDRIDELEERIQRVEQGQHTTS